MPAKHVRYATLRDLVAVHFRHANVKENAIHGLFGDRGQSTHAIVNDLNLVTREFQEHRQGACRINVVVHQQEP